MDKNEGLRKRGQINTDDIEKYKTCSKEELVLLTESKVAVERSAALHILGSKYADEEWFTRLLLTRLKVEKALYTRIEIGEILETGGIETARLMTEYLGEIGSNQYKELPEQGSHKVSYPLQRDLVARSLGKMKPEIFPVLKKVLESDDLKKISEAADAAGYLIFYNQKLATDDNAQFFCYLVDKYQSCELILWKIITCLSAFSQDFVKYKLIKLQKGNYPSVIVSEAVRSLQLIDKRRRLKQ